MVVVHLILVHPLFLGTCSIAQNQVPRAVVSSPQARVSFVRKASKLAVSSDKARSSGGTASVVKHRRVVENEHPLSKKKSVQNTEKKEHHFWHRRDSTGSGQKAFNLVRNISKLPNEKEAVYGALNEWVAWETEFPLIALAKALKMLRNRNQWKQVIQVAKWMLSKGQGASMSTYDCLLQAFDMDGRVDEAETLWNMILHVHNRSVSRRLFSRMISLCDHHNLPNKLIEVFADMEELGVKPDEDTTRRIARAFKALGQEEKQRLVMTKYRSKWKYIHFKGERVRARTLSCDEDSSSDLTGKDEFVV